MAISGVRQFSVFQVSQEPSLVDGVDWADAHRARGELPEVRHEPGVRRGAQALAVHFLPVVGEPFLGESTLKKGARVDSGCGVWLEEHQVAAVLVVAGTEEMIEADFEYFGRG